MSGGRISVVIPTLNGGGYLREAVRSVLAQTRPAAEIFVVDDGGTESAAGALAGLTGVILLRNDATRGPGFCRNAGIARATGDAIALCDHDDVWAPDHLEEVGGLLDRFPEAPLAFSRVGLVGAVSGCWPADAECIPEVPAQLLVPLMRNNMILPTGTVFRKELWTEAGPFDEGLPRGVDDYLFYLETAVRHPIVGRCKPTAFWRIHDRQTSRHRGPQVVRAFEYRLGLLARHRERLIADGRHGPAKDATLRCWEEHIEEAWAVRNMRYLRGMVRFGLGEPFFRRATLPYVGKAGLPDFVVRRLVAWEAIQPPKESIIQMRE